MDGNVIGFHKTFMVVLEEGKKWAKELDANWAREAAKDGAQQVKQAKLDAVVVICPNLAC